MARKQKNNQKQGGKNPYKQHGNPYSYLNLPDIKQLHHETTAATNLAYRPVEQATTAQIQASKQRTKDVGNWWNEYLNTVSQSQGATQQAYANAASQTQGLMNTGAAVDNANTASLNAQQSQAAALRGQDASAANAANTQTANAALSQRNTQLGTLGAVTAGQGANQYSYLANQRVIGAGQSIAARRAEQARTRSIEKDLGDLRKERGEYATKTLGQKESEAREVKLKRDAFNLEKKEFNEPSAYDKAVVTQAELGLKGDIVTAEAQLAAAQAYSHAKERGASAQEATAAANKAAAKIKAGANENVANTYANSPGSDGYSTRQAKAFIRSAKDAKGRPLSFDSMSEAVDYLVNRGVGPGVARKAVNELLHGSTPQKFDWLNDPF